MAPKIGVARILGVNAHIPPPASSKSRYPKDWSPRDRSDFENPGQEISGNEAPPAISGLHNRDGSPPRANCRRGDGVAKNDARCNKSERTKWARRDAFHQLKPGHLRQRCRKATSWARVADQFRKKAGWQSQLLMRSIPAWVRFKEDARGYQQSASQHQDGIDNTIASGTPTDVCLSDLELSAKGWTDDVNEHGRTKAAQKKRSAGNQGPLQEPRPRGLTNSTRPRRSLAGARVQVAASLDQEPFGSGWSFSWKQ